MNRQQLTLIEPVAAWRLDERTCSLGRRGIADARAVLQDARRKEVGVDHVEHAAAA